MGANTFFTSDTTWEVYESPEEAGWSSQRLREAKRYYDSLHSTAAMAIHDGKVLFAWGDVTQNTNAHSIRKSFLNSLYGIHVEKGNIDLNDTLGDVGIYDFPDLTEQEKQAKISDLLSSQSGVFHKAGEESLTMRRNRPNRGSHEPGTFFYYNNWDFNVLGTIFNGETELDLFEEFEEKIADQIGMEDFSLDNTEYKQEVRRSIHPSYLFQVSARDMARFGQLYLQNGKWDGEQIVPEEWIQMSLRDHGNVPRNTVYDYGYLWWSATSGKWSDLGLYSAMGRYGQAIDIIPELDLVFVHRVNSNNATFGFRRSVSQSQRLRLLEMIVEAKESD
ncbi:serine hydrolase domain-containing protein [Evansella tamaricis]|uniref:serine hydrolase domain-containing protein n=1 Tax=Evansella tamaricis TaxID=2069301 RepID=UPI001FE87C9A|nr:serine hydrolase [Evansella tamaricis]